MSEELDYRSSIDDWADKYEKAQKDGIFKGAPNHFAANRQTSVDSFFGPQDSHPTEKVDDADAQYWNAVSKLSDINSFSTEIFSESKGKFDKLEQGLANPITRSSMGMDQDNTPQAVGATYSNDDLDALAELKTKLHDLESKLAAFGSKQSLAKFESQIQGLKDKINELSDALSFEKLGD